MPNVLFRPIKEFTAAIDGINPMIYSPGKDADGNPLVFSVPAHLADVFVERGWGRIVEVHQKVIDKGEEGEEEPDETPITVPQINGDNKMGTASFAAGPPKHEADDTDPDAVEPVKRRRKKKETEE